MNTIPRLALFAISLFALAGCLQIDTLISVRADGSGTVREQVRLSDEAVEMIRQTEQMAKANGAQGGQPGLIDRDKLEQRARAMGPGVTLVSAQELPGSDGFGYEAVWSFEDINTLRVEQRAEEALSQGGTGEEEAGTTPGAAFRLEPGSPAVLHVVSTLAGEGETPAAGGTAAPASEEPVPPEMIREMFQGMRFTVAVEVEGTIVETNASHHSGPRVTLFDLDFDRLLQNPEALELLGATDAPDPVQVKDALRGLPGLTVETETDVRVAFVSDDASMAAMTEPTEISGMTDATAAASSDMPTPEMAPTPVLAAETPEVAPMPEVSAEMPEVTPIPEVTAEAPELAPIPELTVEAPELAPMPEVSAEMPELAPIPEVTVEAPELAPMPEVSAEMPEVTPIPEMAAEVPEVAPMPEVTTELPEVAPMPALAAEVPEAAPMPEAAAVMPDMAPAPELTAAMPESAPTPEPTTMAAEVSVAESVAANRSAAATPTGSIAGYSWRSIPLEDLARQRFKLVSITDAGGFVTKGMVMTIDARSVRLRRASMDGGGFVDLPLDSLRAASVFEEGS